MDIRSIANLIATRFPYADHPEINSDLTRRMKRVDELRKAQAILTTDFPEAAKKELELLTTDFGRLAHAFLLLDDVLSRASETRDIFLCPADTCGDCDNEPEGCWQARINRDLSSEIL